MKISIAMATYNGAKNVEAQLVSFASQELLPDELIVCDDGSKDDTLEIVSVFKKRAPFKVDIHQNERNLGYGQNFCKAMELCGGDLIFLSDQDDVWYPEKVSTIVQLASRHPDKHVFLNDALLTDGDLVSSGVTKLGQLKSTRVGPDSFVQGGCSAVRKEFLSLVLPLPEGRKAHDRWMMELARFLDFKMIYEKELQYYRIHGENTSTHFLNRVGRVGLCYKIMHRFKSGGKDRLKKDLCRGKEEVERIRERLLVQKEGMIMGVIDPNKTDKALSMVCGKLRAICMREKLIGIPKPFRFFHAIKLLLNSDYATHFNGLHSFIRDVLV